MSNYRYIFSVNMSCNIINISMESSFSSIIASTLVWYWIVSICSLSGMWAVSSNWHVCHVTGLGAGPLNGFSIEIWELVELEKCYCFLGLGSVYVALWALYCLNLLDLWVSHAIDLICSILKVNATEVAIWQLDLFPIFYPP